jgi:hypothetical protein
MAQLTTLTALTQLRVNQELEYFRYTYWKSDWEWRKDRFAEHRWRDSPFVTSEIEGVSGETVCSAEPIAIIAVYVPADTIVAANKGHSAGGRTCSDCLAVAVRWLPRCSPWGWVAEELWQLLLWAVIYAVEFL